MSDKLKEFSKRNKQFFIMLGAVAVMFIILSFTVDDFMTYENITNILAQTAPIAIMASGVTFVLVIGGMDISSPSVMAASAVVGVYFMTETDSLIIGSILVVVVAMVFGLLNGLAISKLKMVPLVVTLSMMTIATGLATIINGPSGLPLLPGEFSDFFNKYTVIAMLIIIPFILDYALTATSFGRKLYYIGNNPNASRISGINNQKNMIMAYVICSACAGVAGIINTASLGTARASMGPQSQIIDIISAAVIGGVSVNGGKGRVRDACFGALLVVGVSNVMNMLAMPDYYSIIIKGSIIIVAMGVISLRTHIFVKKGAK